MGSIKKLAGQTLWYGVPTIVSRFLNYLLSILLVGIFKPEAFGVITYLYAFIPFLNIIFTYGLETSYFRFSQVSPRQRVYNTLLSSLLVTTVLFTLPLLFFNEPIARFLDIPDKKQFITWVAWIVFFDTLATLPFALLRQLEKPRKFAFIKVVNIVTNIVFTLFFYLVAPRLAGQPFMGWYKPAEVGVGYVLIANLIASMVTVLLLAGEWRIYRPKFSPRLWKQVMQYSLPLVVVGFGGMVNEMLSRFIYLKVRPCPMR
ncbi:MAG TPA: oligosaccharide flippase family protein [Phnomibacter sp.]|nr:oligosaccharide flippase family protein [Phnomibacter sp.]